MLFSWLFWSVGICTVFAIFTLLLCWYLHCSNRAPEFLPVWNNLQSVAKTDLFVYSLFYFLLLVSFLACFHSGLPPSLGSFLFSTFKFICFQIFSPKTFSLICIIAKKSPTLVSLFIFHLIFWFVSLPVSSLDFLLFWHNCQAFAKTGLFDWFYFFFGFFLVCFHPRLPPCLA